MMPRVQTLRTRIADAVVLVVGLVSVLALAEMAVRPFYAAPPVLRMPQVRFEYSPRFGWEMVPDPVSFSLDQAAPINERHLRGEPVSYERPDSLSRRWLVLGGGSAFGVGMAWEETVVERARVAESSRLDVPIEVVPGGCEGYDLYQSLRYLELEGRRYKPDTIILFFEYGDLPRSGSRDSTFSPERFESVAAYLNRRPDPTPSLYQKLRRASRLVHFIDGRIRASFQIGRSATGAEPMPLSSVAVRPIDLLLGRDSEPLEAAWRTVDNEFSRIENVSRDIGAKVFLVVLPLSPQLRRPYPRARFQSRLSVLCRDHGFVLVDPLAALKDARRELLRLYLPRLPYLNDNGHRAVGDVLARVVELNVMGAATGSFEPAAGAPLR